MTLRPAIGDSFRAVAQDYRDYADTVDKVKGLPSALPSLRGASLPIRIRNDTGFDKDRFSVFSLEAPLLAVAAESDAGMFDLARGASVPAVSDWGIFCVSQEPLAQGAIGDAVVRGLTLVTLKRNFDWLKWCDIGPPGVTDYLEAAPHGSAEILWASAVTGDELLALVDIGQRRQVSVKCKAKALIAPGSTGTVQVWRQVLPAPPVITSPVYEIPGVLHTWMAGDKDLETDTEAVATFNPDELTWSITEAECPSI